MTNSLNSAERTLSTGTPNDGVFFLNILGGPNDRFLLNALKTLFSVPRVLLDLQKCILSGAIKFVSVRSSQGNLSLLEITRASELFSRKFQMQFNALRKCEFFGFPSPSPIYEKQPNLGCKMSEKNLQDKRRKLYMSGTIIQKFLGVLKLWKILGNICFPEQIFYRNHSLDAPDICSEQQILSRIFYYLRTAKNFQMTVSLMYNFRSSSNKFPTIF